MLSSLSYQSHLLETTVKCCITSILQQIILSRSMAHASSFVCLFLVNYVNCCLVTSLHYYWSSSSITDHPLQHANNPSWKMIDHFHNKASAKPSTWLSNFLSFYLIPSLQLFINIALFHLAKVNFPCYYILLIELFPNMNPPNQLWLPNSM